MSPTPPNLSTATLQEVFDYVVGNLKAQGRPSYGLVTDSFSGAKHPGCMYRSEDGAKCAAGWLIPDDKYSPKLEGLASYTTEVSEAIGAGSYSDFKIPSMISTLQAAHDGDLGIRDELSRPMPSNASWLSDFLRSARKIANRYKLNADVCGVSP